MIEPQYNKYTDCLEVHFNEDSYHAGWVDRLLTLYVSEEDDGKCAGYKIKGLKLNFGFEDEEIEALRQIVIEMNRPSPPTVTLTFT